MPLDPIHNVKQLVRREIDKVNGPLNQSRQKPEHLYLLLSALQPSVKPSQPRTWFAKIAFACLAATSPSTIVE